MSSSTVEPEPPGADRSDADPRGDDRIEHVETLAARDPDHRVLPARAIAKREELFGVGPGPPSPPISVGELKSTVSLPSDVAP